MSHTQVDSLSINLRVVRHAVIEHYNVSFSADRKGCEPAILDRWKNHMPAFCGDLEVLKYARMMLDARRLHSADRPRAIPKCLNGIRHEPFAECPCANDAYSGCARPWGTSSFKYPVV